MATLETNLVQPSTGTTLTLGASGDTVALGSGASQSGFGLTDWSESGGSLVASNAAYGIYLGVATATAANLLDDYEEGTWTPVPTAATTNLTASGGDPTGGAYYKVGSTVYIRAHIMINRGTTTGTFSITGLPFAPVQGDYGNNCLLGHKGSDYVYLAGRTNNMGTDSTIHWYNPPPDTSTQITGLTVESIVGASVNRSFNIAGLYSTAA
jgi:hypothetical protein